MERKQKIQTLLNKLEELEAKNPVGSVERLLKQEEETARKSVGISPSGTAIKVLAKGLERVQSDTRPEKLIKGLKGVQKESRTGLEKLSESFAEQIQSLLNEIRVSESRGEALTKAEVRNILGRLAEYEGRFSTETRNLLAKGDAIEEEVNRLSIETEVLHGKLATLPDHTPEIATKASKEDVEGTYVRFSGDIKSLDERLTARINTVGSHGGNANRDFTLRSSVFLSRYTDINLIPGSNMGIVAANNDTTKRTDLTFYSTGGGGSGSSDWLTIKEVDGNPTVGSVQTIVVSNGTLTDDGGGQVTISTGGGGSGITRTTSVISVSTNAGTAGNTDYVYFPNVGIQVNLPSVVGNTNLYTVKNLSASSVLVTSAEGIDGSATVLMPNESPLFASRSFISNGSIWAVV